MNKCGECKYYHMGWCARLMTTMNYSETNHVCFKPKKTKENCNGNT